MSGSAAEKARACQLIKGSARSADSLLLGSHCIEHGPDDLVDIVRGMAEICQYTELQAHLVIQ